MPLQTWEELMNSAGDSAQQTFTPLPDGTYDMIVDEATFNPSQSGKKGYKIKAVVTTGEHARRVVFNTFYVSPDSPTALGIFFRQMAALGLDSAFWKSNPNDDQVLAALKGKPFTGQTKIEGQYANLKNVLPAKPGAPVSLPAAGTPQVPQVPSAGAATPSVTPPAPAPVAPAPQVVSPPAPAAEQPAAPASAPAQDPWATPPAPAAPAGDNPWASAPPPPPPGVPSADNPPF